MTFFSHRSDIYIIERPSQKVYWHTIQKLLCVTLIQFILKTDNIVQIPIRTNVYKILCSKCSLLMKSAQSFVISPHLFP